MWGGREGKGEVAGIEMKQTLDEIELKHQYNPYSGKKRIVNCIIIKVKPYIYFLSIPHFYKL